MSDVRKNLMKAGVKYSGADAWNKTMKHPMWKIVGSAVANESREKIRESVRSNYSHLSSLTNSELDKAIDSITDVLINEYKGPLFESSPVLLFSWRWGQSAFPLVIFSQKLAASLMSTVVSRDSIGDVALPWNAFGVDVPGDLLQSGDEKIVFLGIERCDGNIRYFMITDKYRVISRSVESLAVLSMVTNDVSKSSVTNVFMKDAGDEPNAHEWSRVELLGARLLLGACIELDQPQYKSSISGGSPHKPSRWGEPKSWVYTLGRPIKVDCRVWIREFITGRVNASPTVQTLVRGHHKWQSHGVGRSLRKWIHIEPYWRGPEDAPIIVRPHVITDNDSSEKGCIP